MKYFRYEQRNVTHGSCVWILDVDTLLVRRTLIWQFPTCGYLASSTKKLVNLPGFRDFYYGTPVAQLLPPLPQLPVVITVALPELPPEDNIPPPPPPPPPSPALQPGRAHRTRRTAPLPEPHTGSERLASAAGGRFISVEAKAMQLKALKNALEPCSRKLKEEVQKKGLLSGISKPLSAAALRKLVSAAGMGCAAEKSIATVVGEPE